jgi:hypothetical protein
MSLPSNDFHGSDDELDTGFVFEHLRLRLHVALALRRHDAGLVDHAATQRRIRSLHDLQFPCTCVRDVFVTMGAFSLAQVRRQKLRSGSGIKGVTVPLGDDRRAVDPIAR